MNTFKTLLLREWMQHQRGWLILAIVPMVIMVPLMLFGQIDFSHEPPPPGLLMVMFAAGYTLFLMALAGSVVAFQAPGLARRDQQDRSIEFWLSLPVGHTQSVGATVLMNLLAMPLMVLGFAAAGGVLVGLLAVMRVHGLGGFGDLPWGGLLGVLAAGVPRLALGVVLGVLWLSPLLMAAMAASAWLKRWGVPVLGAAVGFGGLILKEAYDQPALFDTLAALFQHFSWAAVPSGLGTMDFEASPWPAGRLSEFTAWMWKDTLMVLGDLASPLFAGALVVAAIGFGLVVLRRARA
jgi:ABC-2 type transport system permease protein